MQDAREKFRFIEKSTGAPGEGYGRRMAPFNLLSIIRASRPSLYRMHRTVTIKEITPTQTIISDLERIYARPLRQWWGLSRDYVLPTYREVLEEVEQEPPPQSLLPSLILNTVIDEAADNIALMLAGLEDDIARWTMGTESGTGRNGPPTSAPTSTSRACRSCAP